MQELPRLSGELSQSSQTSRRRKPGLILQQMTTEEKANLKKQYTIWTEHAIKQMQTNSINNVTQRIPIMLGVANDNIKQMTNMELTITQAEQNDIIDKVHSEIATWKGIQLGTCKTEKDQYSDYSNTARNWFNRNKAKIYGNHLFYTIIFVKIYEFLLGLSGISNTQKIVLFVDIMDGILHSTVQFKRSKAHPLIPHQTFIQPNMFRRACSNLCHYYHVNWDLSVTRNKRQLLPNGQYAKNRDRSRNINNAFIRKIEEIKLILLCRNITTALPLFNHQSENYYGTVLSLCQDVNPLNQNDEPLKQETSEIPTAKQAHVPSFDAACATDSGNNCQIIDNNNNNDDYRNHIDVHQFDDSIHGIPLQTLPSIVSLPTSGLHITPLYIAPPIIPMSLPIQQPATTQQLLALLNGVNCMNYTSNHGQNNFVSQTRYSPMSSPNVNICLHQNIDGTLRILLDNIP